MRSWLIGQPYEILIITTFSVLPALQSLADEMNREDGEKNPELLKAGLLGRDGKGRVRVFGVEKANKRKQMVEGIKRTETDIIVFADDDAMWPPRLLPLVLACFEDLSIGGVGTSQVVAPLRSTGKLTVWETLAAFRLSIRNVEIAASSYLDGGVPCLSGRTAAYRSIILKDPEFITKFTNDYWRGKYHLNSGDDKFLTRWCVSHGWKTWVQVCKGAELRSTMKDDWTFLKQVLRWTRNTWRSDLRSIFIERHIWTAHPYVAYSMIDKFLNPFTLLAGPALVIFLCARSASNDPINGVYVLPVWNILLSWCVWLTTTRTAKLAPHLWNRPGDVIYVPVWVAFGYYFSVMKLYALFTLHEVGWGTRAGIDTQDTNEKDTTTRSFDPNSPPPFPGVMASFPSQAPTYHSNELEVPSASTAHPSPNPLPTSSPTSTYPSSPPQHDHHDPYSSYSNTRVLSPLSPPRPQPQFAESPSQETNIGSPFQRLEVPSATDEHPQELVDRLEVVCEEEDVLYTLVVLGEMKELGCLHQAINATHSWKGCTALEGISQNSELSQLHKLIAQILLLNGAVYEMEEGEEWSNRELEQVIMSWKSSGQAEGASPARDAQLLLSLEINDAADWIDENFLLPPNPKNLTGEGPLPLPPPLPTSEAAELDTDISKEPTRPSATMCTTSERSRVSTSSSHHSLTSIHTPTFESPPDFLPPIPRLNSPFSPTTTQTFNSLYLSQLPRDFRESELLNLLSRIDVQGHNPRFSPHPYGTTTRGFVDVKASEAAHCVSQLNSQTIDGRTIHCDITIPKSRKLIPPGVTSVRLHIGGLPPQSDWRDVEKMFSDLGVIPFRTYCRCKNQSSAFAFVTVDAQDVERGRDSIDGATTGDGMLSCYVSKE
ncbi:hypothetical protein JCM3765_002500 [Sporobolomyces pararoseus]